MPHFSLRKALSYILRHTPGTSAIPDKIYLQMLYPLQIGKRLHLSRPVTFNEKIQWLKLYDRKPHHTTMVDKYAVKRYVAEKAGEELLIPTLGIWDSFDDIDFSKLPDKFVLKTTHGGGGMDVAVVKDRNSMDAATLKAKFDASMKRSIYAPYREWPYKDVPHRIIAEEYIEDEFGELRDYKFFCMNGEPKFLFLATNRLSNDELTFDFLDINYKRIPVTGGHPLLSVVPEPPQNYDKMVELARKLSQGETFVRVDLYNVRGKIYFGEYTFYHNSGLVPFDPEKYDEIFGKLIELPTQS